MLQYTAGLPLYHRSAPESTIAADRRESLMSSNRIAAGWSRVDGIDLLRGLAIFFVLMNHVNVRLALAKVPYTAGLPEQLVSSLVWKGQYGVQMFFALSGFLITTTALRRWGSLSRVNVRDFYVLRFARIAPLLLLLLLVLSGLHFAHLRNFVVPDRTGGLGRALLAALTFHINVLEAHRGYLPANWDILWSLSVEEMFYLGFPLLCRLLGGGRLLTGLLLGLALLGPVARTLFSQDNELWQEYSYLGGMDAIAWGCLAARLSFGTTAVAARAADTRDPGHTDPDIHFRLFHGRNLPWPRAQRHQVHSPGTGHLHDRRRCQPERLAQP